MPDEEIEDHTARSGFNEFGILKFGTAVFGFPNRIAFSAWTEHVPFMFWLIDALRPACFVELGTHNGMSYCAACQTVKSLGANTACYAIDTWKGDEHAGLYDNSIFLDLQAHHDPRYGAFSRLVRSTFDEALHHFDEASVDVLHIDGLHTYEAVKHDYETWLPKMSQKGIILFHDTNVREHGFGVFRLWDELAAKYPAFEFLHGHGLGVVAVGNCVPEVLKPLFGAAIESRRTVHIREAFAHLGRTTLAYTEKSMASILQLASAAPSQVDIKRFIQMAYAGSSEAVLSEVLKAAEAAQALQELERNEQDLSALARLSFIRSDQNRIDESITLARRMLEIDPNRAGMVAHLGNLYARKGKWGDALRTYDRALEMEPDNRRFKEVRARYHQELQQIQES